jgi:hypothetical protein
MSVFFSANITKTVKDIRTIYTKTSAHCTQTSALTIYTKFKFHSPKEKTSASNYKPKGYFTKRHEEG